MQNKPNKGSFGKVLLPTACWLRSFEVDILVASCPIALGICFKG